MIIIHYNILLYRIIITFRAPSDSVYMRCPLHPSWPAALYYAILYDSILYCCYYTSVRSIRPGQQQDKLTLV